MRKDQEIIEVFYRVVTLKNSEAAVLKYSSVKFLWKFREIRREMPSACNFIKKRKSLWQKHFPVEFANFLKRVF